MYIMGLSRDMLNAKSETFAVIVYTCRSAYQ